MLKRICIYLSVATLIFLFAGCNNNSTDSNNIELEQSTGQIFLYGERHGVAQIMDRQLEIWGEYYNNYNMRHLFVEFGFFTAEFLNLWMQSDNDDILYELFDDWAGTAFHIPHTLVFFRTIKNDFPETIFHGTDVGHQFNTVGKRFLQHLIDNNLQGTEQYLLTLESIEQGEHWQNTRDLEFRITTKTENFIRAFDRLVDQNVMGIYGSTHTNLGFINAHGLTNVPTMAERLRERYGEALNTESLSWMAAIISPIRIDTIIINDVSYEASYFGTNTTVINNIVSRSFWRLENAYDDFKDNPTTGNVMPFDNFPMLIEIGQVFIVDLTFTDGSVMRLFHRSDGGYWQGRPTTVGFFA